MNRLAIALAASLLLPILGFAQVGGSQDTVYSIGPTRSAKVLTLAGQGAGTVNSPDQTGFGVKNVLCVMNQSSHTGTPSTTFSIQNKDPGSGQYFTAITSAAVLLDATPSAISSGGGLKPLANVVSGMPVSTTWRVSATVGGTTPSVTGTIACTIQQ